MRSDHNHLGIIHKSSKALLSLGFGSLLSLAPLDRVIAQDQGASPANAPTTDNSANAANPANPADTSDANAPAGAPTEPLPPDANAANTSRAQVPGVSQTPANQVPTNIPAYQPQLGNPLSPYTSSSTNPQSPQITQGSLYTTGTRDVSQISTNTALAQAFAPQSTDLSSEDAGMNYEHPPIERLRLGPFDLKAAVVAGATFDDNVRNGGTTGGKKGDLDYGVTPAILLEYGNHDGQKGFASLIYAPTITRYYHETNQNNIGQNVAINAIYPLQRLTFNATQTFTQTTGVNTDSNVRTTQEAINSGLGASYEVDDKIAVSVQLQNVITSYSDPGDSQNNAGGNNGGQGETTTSINTTATYRVSDKLTVGPNVNFGSDRPDDTQKSTYEQGTIGLNYAPTEKIGAFAQGGVELRQYDDGGGDKVNPIFAVGISYTPFDSTNLTFNATQASHTSTAEVGQPTGGQTVLSTGVGAAITQRIVQRVFFTFAFTYNHDDDQNNGGGGGGAGGNNGSTGEDTFTYRPSVSFAPTAWSNIAVYYQYLSNESDVPGQSYGDNQLGLSVSAQF